jgi:hypothetical protein
VRSVLVILAVVAGVAPPAAAAPLRHLDLSGLVLASDTIVVARRARVDHPNQYEEIGHYKVERALLGSLGTDADVAVEQFLYATDRHNLDPEVVLFLANGQLVSSGLRVIEAGKLFRFEQFSNPGGWAMVPQGHDPQDNWQANVSAVDLPTFERELAAAVARTQAFTAATAITDRDRRRTAMVDLLLPPGGPHAAGGFYDDELARRIEAALAAAGDVDGALLAFERDRSSYFVTPVAPADQLVAIAADRARPVDVRVAALDSIASGVALVGNVAATRAAIGLLADPSPVVRAAAVAAVAPHRSMSSDANEQAVFERLERDQRDALAKLFASEPDPDVVFALLGVLEHPSGRTRGPDVVGHADLFRDDLRLAVRCTHDVKVTGARLLGPAIPGARIELTCGSSVQQIAQTPAAQVTAGRHPLAVEVTIAGKPVTLTLGTLVANASGELALER